MGGSWVGGASWTGSTLSLRTEGCGQPSELVLRDPGGRSDAGGCKRSACCEFEHTACLVSSAQVKESPPRWSPRPNTKKQKIITSYRHSKDRTQWWGIFCNCIVDEVVDSLSGTLSGVTLISVCTLIFNGCRSSPRNCPLLLSTCVL